MKKVRNIVIVIIALIVIGAIYGGSRGSNNSSNSSSSSSAGSDAGSEVATEETISYASYTAENLVDDLKGNALAASDKYKNQYIEVTGKLGNIDSSGAYINVDPEGDEYVFNFTNIQCYLKSDEQREQIKAMQSGDPITVRGKCSDVGEVLGYSIQLDSIN